MEASVEELCQADLVARLPLPTRQLVLLENNLASLSRLR